MRREVQMLYEHLQEQGLLDYGASFSASLVHERLGLRVPERASYRTFARLRLQEMAAMDELRLALIDEGKYLKESSSGSYRVLLPSENAAQIEKYHAEARRKIARARKLAQHSPPEARVDSQACARLMLLEKSFRNVV